MLNECFIAAALVSADIVYKRLSGIARQLELTSATLLQNVRAGSFGELKRSENLQRSKTIQILIFTLLFLVRYLIT